jgi:hypothetical protein
MRSAHLSVADDAEFELATAIGHLHFIFKSLLRGTGFGEKHIEMVK